MLVVWHVAWLAFLRQQLTDACFGCTAEVWCAPPCMLSFCLYNVSGTFRNSLRHAGAMRPAPLLVGCMPCAVHLSTSMLRPAALILSVAALHGDQSSTCWCHASGLCCLPCTCTVGAYQPLHLLRSYPRYLKCVCRHDVGVMQLSLVRCC
jgi:hypothetical protein